MKPFHIGLLGARNIGHLSSPLRQDEKMAFALPDRFGMANLAFQPLHDLSGAQRRQIIYAPARVAEADIHFLTKLT
jgi:ABC-type Mn2+/Zn2+ transport system ATPase subunit